MNSWILIAQVMACFFIKNNNMQSRHDYMTKNARARMETIFQTINKNIFLTRYTYILVI